MCRRAQRAQLQQQRHEFGTVHIVFLFECIVNRCVSISITLCMYIRRRHFAVRVCVCVVRCTLKHALYL